MKRLKDNFILVLLWIIIIAYLIGGVYASIAYGGKSITEIPFWVVLLYK